MPSILSHYLLAQRILSYLKEEHPDFETDKNAFLWGAQGPDFLYASSDQNIRALADFIHRADASKTLDAVCSFARGTKNKTDQSYALGFLTHYALDSIGHPFVLYGAQQLALHKDDLSETTAHSLIEVTLDVILLRYEKGDLPSSIGLNTCAPKDEKVTQHMSFMYPMLLKNVYEKNVTLDEVTNTARQFQKWLKKHTDRTGLKKDYILRQEKKKRVPRYTSVMYRSITEDDTYDYANIGNSEWTDAGKAKTDSFFDLFEQADTLSRAMIDLFFTDGSASTLTNGKPFI